MSVDVTNIDAPSLPAANQYTIWLDSTRGFTTAVALSASLVSTAGSYKKRWASVRLDFVIGSTAQDVTLVRQIWDGAAWQTVNSGSDTLTAGTLYPYGWVPEAPDWRIYVLAGGTAPDALLGQLTITRGDRAAGT